VAARGASAAASKRVAKESRTRGKITGAIYRQRPRNSTDLRVSGRAPTARG
jgi:hypothetical protein